jgi:RNA polymerase sigma-70 factor, ECF subfamily
MERSEIFLEYRNLLFSIGYDMLGSVADAEDIVQETYLKWMERTNDDIEYPKAYLVKIATNLSINYLNQARKKREQYVGLWLPEPLIKERHAEAADSLDVYNTLSIGMMALLEKLTAKERAIFLLKEVFSYSHAEIADILDISGDNSRQTFRRAKQRLGNTESRFKIDLKVHEKLLKAYIRACYQGDVEALIELLHDDVAMYPDGGGKAFTSGDGKFVAARADAVTGKKDVAEFVVGITAQAKKYVPNIQMQVTMVNGLPALYVHSEGTPVSVVCLDIVNGKVANIFGYANPDKISRFNPRLRGRQQGFDPQTRQTLSPNTA